MLNIDYELNIDASPEQVWDVISDLDAYGEWNPFVRACESSLKVGDPIKMKVQLFPFLKINQKETILAHEEGSMLDYGISIPLGLLASTRKHIVQEKDGVTLYQSKFQLSGALSPIVKIMMGPGLRKGFGAMSEGIKTRAESLK